MSDTSQSSTEYSRLMQAVGPSRTEAVGSGISYGGFHRQEQDGDGGGSGRGRVAGTTLAFSYSSLVSRLTDRETRGAAVRVAALYGDALHRADCVAIGCTKFNTPAGVHAYVEEHVSGKAQRGWYERQRTVPIKPAGDSDAKVSTAFEASYPAVRQQYLSDVHGVDNVVYEEYPGLGCSDVTLKYDVYSCAPDHRKCDECGGIVVETAKGQRVFGRRSHPYRTATFALAAVVLLLSVVMVVQAVVLVKMF